MPAPLPLGIDSGMDAGDVDVAEDEKIVPEGAVKVE